VLSNNVIGNHTIDQIKYTITRSGEDQLSMLDLKYIETHQIPDTILPYFVWDWVHDLKCPVQAIPGLVLRLNETHLSQILLEKPYKTS